VLFRLPFFPLGCLYLPVILSIQLALSLGIGLAGAALNVFYRDIKHLFALVLQVWLYATPIIYPVTMVPERLRPYYFINPMAGIIEAYRAVLLYQRLPEPNLLISAIISVIVLLIGYWFFKRVENQFADVV
jgi:lipopolysaccharide transport system permease protein